MQSALRQATQRTLLAAATTAIGLISAEFVLHLFVSRPVIVSEWLLERPDIFDEDSIMSERHYRKDAYYEIDETLPTVVALGDSFTEGYPVARETDSYPAVLRRLLEKSGTPANVIRLGMGDTGPDQQLVVFEREVLPRLTPDVVIWQIYANDEWNNVDKAVFTIVDGRLERIDAKRHWLFERQRFYDRVPFNRALTQHSYLFRYLLKAAERARAAAVPAEYSTDPHAWARKKIELEIARMNELAMQHGFQTYVLLIAPRAMLPKFSASAEHSSNIAQFVRSHERLFALFAGRPDLIDARFYESDGRTLRDDIWIDDDRDKIAPGGKHFNEEGYALLAELVFDRLRADGVFR